MRLCRLSQRRVGVLGIGRLIVFLFRQYNAFCIMCRLCNRDNICRGTRETISDLNRSLRARYFVSVLNERTSFASRARAFESARLLNCFECNHRWFHSIFSQPPLISFKRDKNVGNFLVRSAFKTIADNLFYFFTLLLICHCMSKGPNSKDIAYVTYW